VEIGRNESGILGVKMKMSQLYGDKIDEVHKNMCLELQGPQKTIIFNTFPTG
jgi:hypothetical protein